MSEQTCAKCSAAMPGGGMMSSDGEVCEACYDKVEGGAGFSVGPLDTLTLVCAALPFLFYVWVNGIGYVHIGAGAIGLAAGGFHAYKSATGEFKNMRGAAIGGGGAAVCAFHLLRGLGVV